MNKKDRNRTIAVGVTIVVHAAVIGILLMMAFTTPLPLPGEAGVEVNLGMYNNAVSDMKQAKSERQVESRPVPQPQKEDVVKQDTEETPAISEPKAVEKPQPVVNKRALFKPKSEQQGTQGNPNGTPNTENTVGNGGSGGGPSYSLGGRGAKHLPVPERNFTEEGVVVVDIWVDRNGHVQRAEIGKGTQIVNSAMRSMAKEAALKAMFTPDDNAAELQKGTITYNFIIRQ